MERFDETNVEYTLEPAAWFAVITGLGKSYRFGPYSDKSIAKKVVDHFKEMGLDRGADELWNVIGPAR